MFFLKLYHDMLKMKQKFRSGQADDGISLHQIGATVQ